LDEPAKRLIHYVRGEEVFLRGKVPRCLGCGFAFTFFSVLVGFGPNTTYPKLSPGFTTSTLATRFVPFAFRVGQGDALLAEFGTYTKYASLVG
jgi:hypothetical protein